MRPLTDVHNQVKEGDVYRVSHRKIMTKASGMSTQRICWIERGQFKAIHE